MLTPIQFHHEGRLEDAASYYINLNTTSAKDSNNRWNGEPTTSVLNFQTHAAVNGSSDTYIAYCFAEKKGYSKFGSYTGNGNADGTFVYTGFKPAWVMIKRTDSGNGWFIMDNKRLGFNSGTTNSATLGNVELAAHDNRSEAAGNTNMMDLLSNGFKCRQSGTDSNTSGGTYIYMAFAESPFTNSNSVPTNAR